MRIGDFEINIESYRIGDTYHCTVDNVQPGAVLARGQGKSREEAERIAVEKASEMLGRTRVFKTPG